MLLLEVALSGLDDRCLPGAMLFDKLQAAAPGTVAWPQVANQFAELGCEPSDMTRQQMTQWMQAATVRWGEVVKDHDIKAE